MNKIPNPTPTPWVDTRSFLITDEGRRGRCIDLSDAHTLERHLRRIVEAHGNLEKAELALNIQEEQHHSMDTLMLAAQEMDKAITAAKEELSR